jgi:alpha-L-fucosidase 2
MNKPLAFILAFFSWITVSMHAAELKRDIEYGRAGEERLLLDAHIPDGEGLHPVAILVHGGGWSRGDKSGLDEPTKGADITAWFGPLNNAGFTWFSINYRLAPAHRWPAGFEDVQCAIRWVKAHAAEFKGDPHRIALFGHSSGGHYVCLAGMLADETTRVQAVVSFAGVTDLEADTVHRGGLSASLQSLFDRPATLNPEVAALLREHSPIAHVRSGLPPFLLLHGDADKTVPCQQALAFQEKLRGAGVRCDLITIPGAPHGLLHWAEYSPNYNLSLIAWLQAHLTASPPAPTAH